MGRWPAARHLDSRYPDHGDLLGPESVGDPGRRAARIGRHGKRTTGDGAPGLSTGPLEVGSLEEADDHRSESELAGPLALFVSKLHRIPERVNWPGRAMTTMSSMFSAL